MSRAISIRTVVLAPQYGVFLTAHMGRGVRKGLSIVGASSTMVVPLIFEICCGYLCGFTAAASSGLLILVVLIEKYQF